jgi:predicted NAD-dependent protein-ADP-ribosyltransferase YbiA (DUF1768 family)
MHHSYAERFGKELVIEQNKVLYYKVVAEYGTHSSSLKHPLDLTASKFKIELNYMKLKKGGITTDENAWEKAEKVPGVVSEIEHNPLDQIKEQ